VRLTIKEINAMKKTCVFCGEHPISKTKEHVLPSWLLGMTGGLNRPLHLPLLRNKFEKPERPMSFGSFHFPACESCNFNFSSLENTVKPIVERMMAGGGITNEEVSTFLDWLGKVRTGLWLGILFLEKNPFNIAPRFHIGKRMGGKDRVVVIYRTSENWRGISFIGINFPIFHHAPSCFSLIVNHLGFFNISTEYLFSRRLGFPYPEHSSLHESGLSESIMKSGRERVMFPLLKYPYSTVGTELFQPMFPIKTIVNADPLELSNLYNTNYVRNYSLKHAEGVGLPLIQKDKSLTIYSHSISSAWLPQQVLDPQKMRNILGAQKRGRESFLSGS
jgi:hypothetical protein